jgi:hypothetical protein
MGDILVDIIPDPRRVLDWLPPKGEWRELWFTYRPGLGPLPDEPILADLEAAIAAGWAEDSGLTFGFNDDDQVAGARTMRAYCTTAAGLRMKAGRIIGSAAGPASLGQS